MGLQDVTILITTFLRPGYLERCVQGAKINLSECVLLVVDDSEIKSPLANIELPFDSGLAMKRNVGVAACKTKYLLLGCDDFDFSTLEARQGVEKLIKILDENPEIDIAGGRVDGHPYEGNLEYAPGEYIREHRVIGNPNNPFTPVDLTVNYFMGRTEIMKQFPWPEEMRIGGEHVCFFLDLKHAGRKVVWVPGVNINTLYLGIALNVQDPRYGGYRRRAINLGHPLMKKRYNIKNYIGFEGDRS